MVAINVIVSNFKMRIVKLSNWIFILFNFEENFNLKANGQFGYVKTFKYVWNNRCLWIYFPAVNLRRAKCGSSICHENWASKINVIKEWNSEQTLKEDKF